MTVSLQTLEDFGHKFGPPGRALSRLIRPAIAAPEGRTFVWGDWSSIEARKLPWLADTRGSRALLDIIREADADPENRPDLYCREAAAIEGSDLAEFWDRFRNDDPVAKAARQTGKVAVLSLGFGGAVGALQAMAVGYGISLSEDEARVIVEKWRENNRWARAFWDALWEAFLSAMDSPDEVFPVGRVAYVYDKHYLGGTVMCFLPDGRPLTYPTLRWAKVDRENIYGEVETRTQLTYRRGYDRRSLWYGVLAENITQAAAGSLLRDALTSLSPAPALQYARQEVAAQQLSLTAGVIGHTHDEIIVECDDDPDEVAHVRGQLYRVMTTNPGWAEGCPLAAEVSDNWYYSKVVG